MPSASKRHILPDTVAPDLPHARQRSAVTNGTRLFIDGDEGGPFARRFRDIIALHVTDLGGLDVVSQSQRSLCRLSAGLQLGLEGMEAAMSRGEAVDFRAYDSAGKSLSRLLRLLGLQRVEKPYDWRAAMKQASDDASA